MLIISHRSDACDVTPATDAEKGQKPAYQCKEGGCCLPRGWQCASVWVTLVSSESKGRQSILVYS